MPDISALCPYLAPKPSRTLGAFLIGVHVLALSAAWLNPLPVLLRLALSLAIGWSLWRHLHPPTTIVGLRVLPDGSWRLDLSNGGQTDAQLLGSSIATPWLVLLHLRTEQGPRHNLLICRDSLEPDAFRRLRVVLRVVTLEGDKPGGKAEADGN